MKIFVNELSLSVYEKANELSIFCVVLCVEWRVELYASTASHIANWRDERGGCMATVVFLGGHHGEWTGWEGPRSTGIARKQGVWKRIRASMGDDSACRDPDSGLTPVGRGWEAETPNVGR